MVLQRLYSLLKREMLGKTIKRFDTAYTKLSAFEKQHQNIVSKRAAKVIPVSYYGGRRIVTMIPGDGIGIEVMECVVDILDFMGTPIDFEVVAITEKTKNKQQVDEAIISIQRNRVALAGSIAVNLEHAEYTFPNVALRQHLDLYVNLIWMKSYPGVKCRYPKPLDIILVRQNTEAEYAMLEHESVRGIVESLRIITTFNSERLAKYAFEFATSQKRKKITIVHKANIMKLSDGLFLSTTKRIGKKYPHIKVEETIVDNCCTKLIENPQQFDVMVVPNLYGNIISSIISGLLGGPGLFNGKNYGDHYALFEPATRNLAMDIVGKNLANPIAMLNATVSMLKHLGIEKQGYWLNKAIHETILVDKIHTRDIGGKHNTSDVVANIKKHVFALMKGTET